MLYMSAFSEPVPLVMMEAFMAGLPLIIARPRAPSPLVQPEHTCLCFDPEEPETLVEAIRRLHDDASLRERLTANARELVDGPFSLHQMGAQYDALLRKVASKSEAEPGG
jgi:glycosyltransferase involved in cell wall biosynthesis